MKNTKDEVIFSFKIGWAQRDVHWVFCKRREFPKVIRYSLKERLNCRVKKAGGGGLSDFIDLHQNVIKPWNFIV